MCRVVVLEDRLLSRVKPMKIGGGEIQLSRLRIDERQDLMRYWISLRGQLTRPPLIKLSSHVIGYLGGERKMILQRTAAYLRERNLKERK